MQENEESEETKTHPGCSTPATEILENAEESMEINADNEDVIKIENGLVQVSIRQGHDGAEEGGGIGGVRQPVFVEKAEAALSKTVQEILVLVGVVQGRLRVGEAKQQ